MHRVIHRDSKRISESRVGKILFREDRVTPPHVHYKRKSSLAESKEDSLRKDSTPYAHDEDGHARGYQQYERQHLQQIPCVAYRLIQDLEKFVHI